MTHAIRELRAAALAIEAHSSPKISSIDALYLATHALNAASREVNKIVSVAELDALPQQAVVQGYDGFRHEKRDGGKWLLLVSHETRLHDASEVELPALVRFGGVGT